MVITSFYCTFKQQLQRLSSRYSCHSAGSGLSEAVWCRSRPRMRGRVVGTAVTFLYAAWSGHLIQGERAVPSFCVYLLKSRLPASSRAAEANVYWRGFKTTEDVLESWIILDAFVYLWKSEPERMLKEIFSWDVRINSIRSTWKRRKDWLIIEPLTTRQRCCGTNQPTERFHEMTDEKLSDELIKIKTAFITEYYGEPFSIVSTARTCLTTVFFCSPYVFARPDVVHA